jgi:hypothetical protein
MYKEVMLFSLLTATAILGACPRSNQRQTPLPRVFVPTNIVPVVQIQTECGSCTGWIVKRNTFVTAAHCFGGPHNKIRAVFTDKKTRRLSLSWLGNEYIPTEDTAILKGDSRDIKPLEIETAVPKVPTMCLSIGYGIEGFQKASPCVAGPTSLSPGTLYLYQMRGDVDFGDSGGPVLNKDGKVIGETVIKEQDDATTFYVVPNSFLIERILEHGATQ